MKRRIASASVRHHRRSTKVGYHELLEHVVDSMFKLDGSLLEPSPTDHSKDTISALIEQGRSCEAYFRAWEYPKRSWGPFRRTSDHVTTTLTSSSVRKFLTVMRFDSVQRHTTLTEFSLFPKLPPELRLAIWTEAAKLKPGRIVELHVRQPYWQWPNSPSISASPRTLQPRTISQVSREARLAVTDLHNVKYGIPRPFYYPGYTGSLYFNFDKDILYINTIPTQPRIWTDNPLRLFLAAAPTSLVANIRVLAISYVWKYEMIFAALEKFPSLEVLIVVLQATFPTTAVPSELVFTDVPQCERFGAQAILQLWDPRMQRLFMDWLRKEHVVKPPSTSWKRKIWFAHTGPSVRWHGCHTLCHYCNCSSRPFFRHRIRREIIEFSDNTRGDEWWRSKQWNGTVALGENGKLEWHNWV